MGKQFRWLLLAVCLAALLSRSAIAVQADEPPALLINEIKAGVEKSVEFYNPSTNPVNLDGYTVAVADQSGNFYINYPFPSGASIQGHGYAILHLRSGTNSPGVFYLSYDPPIFWNGGGVVALYEPSTAAIDFVRFNGSLTAPPAGTTWTGTTPTINNTDNSLGRDNLSTDTDDGADWIEQSPSLGAQNEAQQCYFLTITKEGSGVTPNAVEDRSEGCGAGFYHAGETVALVNAAADSGWAIGGWSGSDNDNSRTATNTVTMPAGAHTVSVIYRILPAQITLLTPVDQAQTADTTPLFEWQAVENADRYVWEIRRMSDNSVVEKLRYAASARCTDGVCRIPSPVVLDPGDYKWHVTGQNHGVTGAWSLYHRLSVILPGPNLRSPGVDAVVYGGRPTFKWYPDPAAVSYRVEVLDAAQSSLGNWGTAPACAPYWEFRLPFDLEDAYGDYTWQVKAIYADSQSAWSDARTFSYVQLARTVQQSPADGFISDTTTPQFSWDEITGATLYLFQVRLPDDTFVGNWLVSDATYCVDGGLCTWSIPDGVLADGSEYKWHVRAKNGRNFGRWTAYREIIIE